MLRPAAAAAVGSASNDSESHTSSDSAWGGFGAQGTWQMAATQQFAAEKEIKIGLQTSSLHFVVSSSVSLTFTSDAHETRDPSPPKKR